MKKFFTKLIALLFLLVAGMGSIMAADYRVIWDTTISGAGYVKKGNVTTANDATTLTTSSTVTAATLSNFLEPRAVEGYTIEMGMTKNNEIYIRYAWHDDVFEYSTLYTRTSYDTQVLPAGEVAIRLYLGGEEELSDTVTWQAPSGRFVGRFNETDAGNTYYAADDDGDDLFGTYGTSTATAKFQALGRLDNGTGISNAGVSPTLVWFYLRTHMVRTANASSQVNVTVPQTVTFNGSNYKVTAIQKWGFCYAKSSRTMLYGCTNYVTNDDLWKEESPDYPLYEQKDYNRNINDHSNDYLQSVDFGTNSNITSIGDYAFMSCNYIKEITLPWTVEYLGAGTFECCQSLERVEFQVCPTYGDPEFGTTRIRTIEDWTFYSCIKLQTLYLADGITRIEGQTYGAPLQYLASLTYIRLPNTLTYIGPHFLCTALSLETVTIPASVTYIDGAAFHGCESLKTVYMLGKPADLQAASGGNTFSQNVLLCGNHVHDCHFIVPPDQLADYKAHSTWALINENGSHTGTKNGNYLEKSTGSGDEHTQDFTADKWATIIFPHRYMINSVRVDEGVGVPADVLNSVFGSYADGTYVAELSTVTRDRSDEYLYHLSFTQIETDYIPSGKPLMIKPAKQVTGYVMYDKTDIQMQSGFTLEMSSEHPWPIQANNGAVVTMKGKYIDEPLKRYDFIFTASEPASDGTYTYKFRKLMDGKATARAFKCWWSISLDGIFANVNAAGVAKERLFDGLDEVETDKPLRFVVDAIYDLNGRKLDVPKEELPSGMFIVNGKKVVVK